MDPTDAAPPYPLVDASPAPPLPSPVVPKRVVALPFTFSLPVAYTPTVVPAPTALFESTLCQALLADLCLSICSYSYYCILHAQSHYSILQMHWICTQTTNVLGRIAHRDLFQVMEICRSALAESDSANTSSSSQTTVHIIAFSFILFKTVFAFLYFSRRERLRGPVSSQTLDYLLGSIALHASGGLLIVASMMELPDRTEWLANLAACALVVLGIIVIIERWFITLHSPIESSPRAVHNFEEVKLDIVVLEEKGDESWWQALDPKQ